MKLQRYTFEKAGDGYQFTTTTDGLWVMAKDVEELEEQLAATDRSCDACLETIDRLREERNLRETRQEAIYKDAARYRWLRDTARVGNPFPRATIGEPPFQISFRLNTWGESLDEVIDAALRERGD